MFQGRGIARVDFTLTQYLALSATLKWCIPEIDIGGNINILWAEWSTFNKYQLKYVVYEKKTKNGNTTIILCVLINQIQFLEEECFFVLFFLLYLALVD